MKSFLKNENCNGCHACLSICPLKCISMISDVEGFLNPCIDKELCIDCGLCRQICPLLTKVKPDKYLNKNVYACYCKDKFIRQNSSSGGLFTSLANFIIEKGGIVFAAKFDNEFNVLHDSFDDKNQIGYFRGSKYVQSTIGNSFIKIKDLLKKNQIILFAGTPCQVGGLKSYLKIDYENLYCIDFICHGVPSPLVWSRYINFINNNSKKIKNINFRDKSKSWENFSIKLTYKDGNCYCENKNKNVYMRGYLYNLFLRPSCYNCSFKTIDRFSDITLADFWGIENIQLHIPHCIGGTSLLITNSQKGQNLFDNISSNLIYEAAELSLALQYNSMAYKSAKKNRKRKVFFKQFIKGSIPFDLLIEKYCKNSYVGTLKNKLIHLIKT